MKITARNFKGEIPMRDPRLLPEGYGQAAVNCDLDRGTVCALPDMATETPSTWTFVDDAADVDVVPANVSGVDRLLVSGLSGHPEARQGDTVRRWGVVKPETIPTVSVQGTPDDGANVNDSPSYRYSFVTDWGEESDLSQASMPVDVKDGEYVALSNFDIPSVDDCGNDITHIRVYRTATGEEEAEYQLVPLRTSETGDAEEDISVSDITDVSTELYDCNDSEDGLNQNLGEVQMTEGWDPLPDDVHSGVEYANGVYAAAKDKKVYLSEPGYYYAFPSSGLLDYTFELEYEVVGLGVFNQQLVVCTGAYPEIISGADPASASRYQMPQHHPCLAKASIVSTPMGVFYVSSDGGVLVTDSGAEVMTRRFFSRSQWRALPLSDAVCAWFNGKIFVFFKGADHGVIIDPAREHVVSMKSLPIDVARVFLDEQNDFLYLRASDDTWMRWQGSGSSFLEATYSTGIYSLYPAVFNCARVLGKNLDGNAVLKVYGDGTKKAEINLSGDTAFRLPVASRARQWYMEAVVSGGAEIYEMHMAQSMRELKQVG